LDAPSRLREAKEILARAFQELDEGVKSGDPLKVRGSCEKGWLAVVTAVDALLASDLLPASPALLHLNPIRLGFQSLPIPIFEGETFRLRASINAFTVHAFTLWVGVVPIVLVFYPCPLLARTWGISFSSPGAPPSRPRILGILCLVAF
jgi:hypothetical protein